MKKILATLRKRDGERARRVMREHLRRRPRSPARRPRRHPARGAAESTRRRRAAGLAPRRPSHPTIMTHASRDSLRRLLEHAVRALAGQLRPPAQRRVRRPRRATASSRGAASRRSASTTACSASRCRRSTRSTACRGSPGLAGAGSVAGPTMMQACATGVRVLLAAAQEIEAGMAEVALVVTCDRTSNGPHLYYPNPRGPGGTGAHEDWVMDNFGCDPLGAHSMLDTAENVARQARHHARPSSTTIVLRREEQYRNALADDSAFLKRFMTLPFDVPAANFAQDATTLDGDEGINHSTPEGLAQAEAGAGGRHRHLRRRRRIRPTATRRSSSRRRDRARELSTQSEDRRAPARLRAGARPLALDARGHRAGGAARARAGGTRDRADRRDQDAQPVRGERPLFSRGDRRRLRRR